MLAKKDSNDIQEDNLQFTLHLQNAAFSASAFQIHSFFFSFFRFAYSEDGFEDFDREESLSLIKPGPIPPKDTHSSTDAKTTSGFNTTDSHNEDIEEDKRE